MKERFSTFLHIYLDVIKRLGPIVPLFDDFISKGSASRMVPTITIMDLLHYYSGFLLTEASQVCVGVQFGIRLLVHEVSKE